MLTLPTLLQRAPQWLALSLFAACTSQSAAPAVTYHHDIKPIVDATCAQCHAAGGIAPTQLDSYAALYAARTQAVHAVQKRVMPPWLPAQGFKPLQDDHSLTDAQIDLFTRWLDAGAPEGDPADPGEALHIARTDLSRVDLEVKMPEPYTPKDAGDQDDYRCLIFDLPIDHEQYITGFRGVPGAVQEVHHMVAFVMPPEVTATLAQWDAKDDGPGYGCFGTPTRTGEAQIPGAAIGTWAPGSGGHDLPAGTGMLVKPGSKLVLQMHYNLASGKAVPDQSKVQLSLADKVTTRGYYAAFFDLNWYMTPALMAIPAGEPDVAFSFFSGLPDAMSAKFFVGAETFPNGFLLHSTLPHQHTRGKSIRIYKQTPDGQKTTLQYLPRWDFHWQRDYFFVEPEAFGPKDKLGIECHFDNSPAGQEVINGVQATPKALQWGESTADEMCLAFVYVTPL